MCFHFVNLLFVPFSLLLQRVFVMQALHAIFVYTFKVFNIVFLRQSSRKRSCTCVDRLKGLKQNLKRKSLQPQFQRRESIIGLSCDVEM